MNIVFIICSTVMPRDLNWVEAALCWMLQVDAVKKMSPVKTDLEKSVQS